MLIVFENFQFTECSSGVINKPIAVKFIPIIKTILIR